MQKFDINNLNDNIEFKDKKFVKFPRILMVYCLQMGKLIFQT